MAGSMASQFAAAGERPTDESQFIMHAFDGAQLRFFARPGFQRTQLPTLSNLSRTS